MKKKGGRPENQNYSWITPLYRQSNLWSDWNISPIDLFLVRTCTKPITLHYGKPLERFKIQGQGQM
jgi:hypothetical protein